MMDVEAERVFRAKLDQLGYTEVRAMIARGVWNRDKVGAAEVWLADQDDKRADQGQTEALKISRSAKNAAWVAAIAAVLSLPIAVAALIFSLLKP